MVRVERDRQAEERARGLVELVRPHLPVVVRTTGPADAWPLVGPALIARQVGAVEAIFRLYPSGRDADPQVVLRRLKADDDCRELGEAILTDEKRTEFQRQKDTLPAEMPSLADRAAQADDHWTGKIEGLRGADQTHSYRGLYAIAYRRDSAIDHASLMGLNRVTVDMPDGSQRIQLEERDPEEHGVYGRAGILLAFSLFISAQTLGWPETDAVHEVFRRDGRGRIH